ncbi:15742_t:CDS:2 [Funneliformis mosseae]|uniref:15742_t:CDS:1 n=1 Tax=Funneliformis mosseae TaxID=27381 RepID=A0A9N9C5X7_FUNMO|nr:15742_t:CDS:2 [Funneliformis mosseae]
MSSNQFYELKHIEPVYCDSSRQGYVKEIVTVKDEVKVNPAITRPPKVVFVDRHGHEIILLQEFNLNK